jgi:hypothetical protein
VLVAGAEDGPLLPALRAALTPLGAALRLIVAPLPRHRAPPLPPGAALLPWDPLGGEAAPVEAELVLGLALSPRCGAGHKLAEALRRATAPGGALLLAEPLPDLFWDITEGLDPAWWSAPRLLDAAGWRAALAPWGQSRLIPLAAAPWPAALVLAQAAPGAELLPAAPARRFALWSAPALQPWAEALAEELAHSGASVALLPADPAPKALRGALLLALPGPDDIAALARLAAAAEGVAEGLPPRGARRQRDPPPPGCWRWAASGERDAALAHRRHDLAAAVAAGAAPRLAAALLTPPDAEAEQR